MKARNVAVRAVDVIPYIFGLGEGDATSNSAQAERARHPDELRKSGSETQTGLYYPSLRSRVVRSYSRMFPQITSTTSHIRSYRQLSVFVIRSKELTALVSPSAWVRDSPPPYCRIRLT
jgi:hypothetical protein